ncbi:MAG: hypothetical protein HUU46_06675 [Candidatus Hydrogenedentes bacterium]|nr:hypothetical protein [Candidatus Hydrogenedentota bacterium]
MKHAAVFLAILIIPQAAIAEFHAAIAYRVVTPKPLLPMVGGVGPASPANETRGDLTVRALVLENGGTRVAICSADFIGFPSPLCRKVRAQVTAISTSFPSSGLGTHS